MSQDQDCVIPFLFEHLDIRGAWVSLDETWAGLTHNRSYPAQVARVLGDMSAVSALIGANLKQSGRMTFQLRGDGPLNLLVLDCDEQLRLRGMARCQPGKLPDDALSLIGHGQLMFTLDAAGMRQPYQSMVPLEAPDIAAIFEHYLTRSEQQPTRLVLATDTHRSRGLFVQTLPGAGQKDEDGWNRIQHLLLTLRPEELLTLSAPVLLQRLFPEEDLRIFDPRPVCHHCPEDREKIYAMLRSLGREECDAVLREHGEIHVRDDICNRDYRLDADAVAAMFAAPRHSLH